MAAVLAVAAAVAGMPLALGLVLAVAGAAVGTLFMTLYLLVGELTPPGAATRVFGWLVTANNAGVGLGAAVAGEVVRARGGASGMWLAAGCALLGLPIALGLAVAGSRADMRRPSPKGAP
jgi:predicted MFS family arabinose efflux permease